MSSDYVSLVHYAPQFGPKYMRMLEKAIRLDPKNEAAWKRLSTPYLYMGMYEKWHEYSDKAIQLNSKAWQGWRGHHKLYYFRDYGGALYDLDATDTLTVEVTDYAEYQSVDYMRGLCYLGLKNHEKSKEFFQLYLDKELASTGSVDIDDTAYLYLSILAIDDQDYAKALEHLEQIEEEEILADKYYHMAYAQFMIGDVKLANENISKAQTEHEDKNYHHNRLYEVLNQIYDSDILKLQTEIACFL